MDGSENGGLSEGAGDDQVVQVVMQENGSIVMPDDGQFIQVDMDEGQAQFIQLTGENGENHLYQLTRGPDGEAQYTQVTSTGSVDDGGGSLDQFTQILASDSASNSVSDEVMPLAQVAVTEDDQSQTQHISSMVESKTVQEGENQFEGTQGEPEHGSWEIISAEKADSNQENVGIVPPDKPAVLDKPLDTDEVTPIPDSGSDTIQVVHSLPSTSQDHVSTSQEETTPEEKAEKQVDMEKPIELTSETVVMVNGKKCLLRIDANTSHLVAYPVKPEPGKRPRGRPKKIRTEEPPVPNKVVPEEPEKLGEDIASQRPLSEQENSAAEGLLGLSDTGPDGRRRSTRARKKNTIFSDYETGKIEDVDDENDEEETESVEHDPDVIVNMANPSGQVSTGIKRGRGRPPKSTTPNPAQHMQTMLMNMGIIPMKRGRGRPRRRPLPSTNNTGPIPAFIIPSPGGKAVMMAPIGNINQLQSMAVQAKPIDTSTSLENTPIIIQNSDGTQTQILPMPSLQPASTLATVVQPTTPSVTVGASSIPEAPQQMQNVVIETPSGEQVVTTVTNPMANETGTDSKQAVEELVASEQQVDTNTEVDDIDNNDAESAEELGDEKKAVIIKEENAATAMIQLPPSLVSLLVPKKEPIKIGLKASEVDLEKLKCPKCDFQAYYQQQYQDHIMSGSHADDVKKCKCCSYVAFEEETLLTHFRETHPKCICEVCNFTAEHAYIVKRHMARHNQNGCECEICGKSYKDQYILKMHIKIVHMPAEVLFECQVCSKKFNRKAHLKRHLRIHDPEKPFKCPQCDYRGCERSDISKHILIHDEPKHICEVCGKAFRHIKNKDLHVKRHRGQRDYKCGVCDFYGYTFTDIRKHIERKHSDAKNIICDKCGTAFKSDTLLREHQHKDQCELIMMGPEVRDDGGQTTIAIPTSHLTTADGQILVDGNQVNITVEQIDMAGDESTLGEGTITEGQIITSQGQVIDASQVGLDQLADGQVIEGAHVVEMVDEEEFVEDTEMSTSELHIVPNEENMIAMSE